MKKKINSDLIKASSSELSDEVSGRRLIEKEFSKHSDPFPDPKTLQGYEQVQPGFAERRIKMAEADQIHSHNIDNKVLELQKHAIDTENKKDKLDNYCALIIGICVLILCGYAIYKDAIILAGTLGTTTALGVLAYFLRAKRPDNKQKPKNKKNQASLPSK